MKQIHILKRLGFTPLRTASASALVSVAFALTACGGGGGGSLPPPEAIVTNVQSVASVLEGGAGGSSDLTFAVTFDKPVVARLELKVGTVSLIKSGFASTPGAAQGGAACDPGVDYLALSDASVVFAAGARSGVITVKVCGDAGFEPNEALDVTWKPVDGSVTTVRGLIINDEAGGLNGTGSVALLGGVSAFGRDVNDLTKNDSDGALGFSFDPTISSPCVLDKVTGLTWQKSWPSTGVAYSQAGFKTLIDNANSAKLCGKSDWRVPSSNELLSLMNFSVTISNPINADAMGSTSATDRMTGEFWSREEVTGATNNAWVVSPGQGGAVSSVAKTTATPLVRLVSGEDRAAACLDAADRFTVVKSTTGVADGTVYDKKSGLMWKQCTEGLAGAQCNQQSTSIFDSTKTSATYIKNWLKNVNDNPITLGSSFNDWRVPTVKELASLADRCISISSAPVIDSSVFPGTLPLSYLSANLHANDSSQSWYLDFKEGTIAVGPPENKYLRLVRAGQ